MCPRPRPSACRSVTWLASPALKKILVFRLCLLFGREGALGRESAHGMNRLHKQRDLAD